MVISLSREPATFRDDHSAQVYENSEILQRKFSPQEFFSELNFCVEIILLHLKWK